MSPYKGSRASPSTLNRRFRHGPLAKQQAKRKHLTEQVKKGVQAASQESQAKQTLYRLLFAGLDSDWRDPEMRNKRDAQWTHLRTSGSPAVLEALDYWFTPSGELDVYTPVEIESAEEELLNFQIGINLLYLVYKSNPDKHRAHWEETRGYYDKYIAMAKRGPDPEVVAAYEAALASVQAGTTNAACNALDVVSGYELPECTGAPVSEEPLTLPETQWHLRAARGTFFGELCNSFTIGVARWGIGVGVGQGGAAVGGAVAAMLPLGPVAGAATVAALAVAGSKTGDHFVGKMMKWMQAQLSGSDLAGGGVKKLMEMVVDADAQYTQVLRGILAEHASNPSMVYSAILNHAGEGSDAYQAAVNAIDVAPQGMANWNCLLCSSSGPIADPQKLLEYVQTMPADDLESVQGVLATIASQGGIIEGTESMLNLDGTIKSKLAELTGKMSNDYFVRITKSIAETVNKYPRALEIASWGIPIAFRIGFGYMQQAAIRKGHGLKYVSELITYTGTATNALAGVSPTAIDDKLSKLRIQLNRLTTSTLESQLDKEHSEPPHRGIKREIPRIAAKTNDPSEWTRNAEEDRFAVFDRFRRLTKQLNAAALKYYDPRSPKDETVTKDPQKALNAVFPLVERWNREVDRLIVDRSKFEERAEDRKRETGKDPPKDYPDFGEGYHDDDDDDDRGPGGGGWRGEYDDDDDGFGDDDKNHDGTEMSYEAQRKVWNERTGRYKLKIPLTDKDRYSKAQLDERDELKKEEAATLAEAKKEQAEAARELKAARTNALRENTAKAKTALKLAEKRAQATDRRIAQEQQRLRREREETRKKEEKEATERRKRELAPETARVLATAEGAGQAAGLDAMGAAHAQNNEIALGDLMGLAAEAAVDAASESARRSGGISAADLGRIGRAANAAVKRWWRVQKEGKGAAAGAAGGLADPHAEIFAPLLAQPGAAQQQPDNGAGVGIPQQQQPEAEEEEEEGEDSDEEEEEEDEDEDDEEDEDEDSEDDFGDDEAAAPAPAGPRWDGRIDYNAPARSSRDSVVDALFARLAL